MNKQKNIFSHRNNYYYFFGCRGHILCHCFSEKESTAADNWHSSDQF